MRHFLKDDVLERIKDNDELVLAIAKANDVRFRTVLRWILENNIILTTQTVLDLIREGLQLSPDTEITEQKEIDAANAA